MYIKFYMVTDDHTHADMSKSLSVPEMTDQNSNTKHSVFNKILKYHNASQSKCIIIVFTV